MEPIYFKLSIPPSPASHCRSTNNNDLPGLRFVLTYDINEELHNSFSKDVTKEQIEAGGGEVRTKLLSKLF